MLPFKIIFAFLYDLLLIAVWIATSIPFVLWQGEALQDNWAAVSAYQMYLLASPMFI